MRRKFLDCLGYFLGGIKCPTREDDAVGQQAGAASGGGARNSRGARGVATIAARVSHGSRSVRLPPIACALLSCGICHSSECGPATLPGHYAAAAEKLFPRWLAWESGSSCDACPLAVGRLLHACDDDDMMDSDVPGASGGGEEATGAPTRARNRAAQHSGVAHATERTCSARA
ncbi:hypothetical protein MTO96_005432 [Rhipicephalus appendiculatus]